MSKMYTELEVAKSFEKYSRMLEITAQKQPELSPGLAISVALVKLWTQIYAPGHPDHPFLNFGMKLPEILAASAAAILPMGMPRPSEPTFSIENFQMDKREILSYILKQQGEILSKNVLKYFRETGRKFQNHQVSNCFSILADSGVLIRMEKGVYQHAKVGE